VSIIDTINGSGILDTEAALKRIDGNKELYNIILETFIKKHAQDHVQVIKYIERGDNEAARGVMHSLKGVAQIVGSDDLHNMSVEIDLLLKNSKSSALQEILERFKKMLAAVIIRIQINLDQTEKTKSTRQQTCITSKEKVLLSVEFLAELLRMKDLEATREAAEVVKYLPDLVSTSHIVALQKNLDSLDFNNAATTLQSIKQQIMAAD
jgi:HPt (histidine-containing phosphotransfer) domain-containing protein